MFCAYPTGFRALFTGMVPTIVGIIPYAGIQLMSYDLFTNWLAEKRPDKKASKSDTFWAGALAGAIAQTMAFPLELCRRKLQAQGGELVMQSSFAGNVASVATATSCRHSTSTMTVATGSGPTMVVRSASSPVQNHLKYDGFLDCLQHTFRKEGIWGLYKGLWPNYLKIVPAAGISFTVFENLKHRMGDYSR